MNLLYIWNEPYSGKKRNDGYLLSSRYKITFDHAGAQLSIRRRESLSANDFWGEHIYDVMAVVGGNGAGKTRLAYSIMDTLDEAISDTQQSRFPFLLVFEAGSEEESKIKIFSTGLEFVVDTPLPYDRCREKNDLRRFKFAYFTDALSLTDYSQKKYGVVYDGSLGGNIRQAFEFNREMHYIDRAMSPIINYFDDEMDRILKFVCFERDKEQIPFHMPEWVTFSLKGHEANLDYISEQLDKMELPKGKNILKKKCREIKQEYGMNAKSSLAIHMMLNLFKAYCIPQTSSEHLEKIAKAVLGRIDHMVCSERNPFVPILELIDQIKLMVCYPEFLTSCQNMLLWIEKQPAFRENKYQDAWTLSLVNDAGTVKQLYDYYQKTKFPLPYFSISFGLSTGEYAFLRRFVRINELLSGNSNGHAYVTNNLNHETPCDSLMIYLDEADQSLHPEWQRKQVDWLLQFISARFKTCKVQLVIATHSPIILSDIPRNHVLYMSNDGQDIQAEEQDVRTFGSNIHTLFRDAFFLSEGTMGAFAERKINKIAQSLQKSEGEIPPDTLKVVEEIGDDVIRNKLRQMCRVSPSPEPRRMDCQTVERTIHILRSQVDRLEAAIRELERMNYD